MFNFAEAAFSLLPFKKPCEAKRESLLAKHGPFHHLPGTSYQISALRHQQLISFELLAAESPGFP